MFRPPTKYSEYLIDVRKSIDYILKRVNAKYVSKIIAGENITISPSSGEGDVTISLIGPVPASSSTTLITEVYNQTGATLTRGTIVYINGAHGNLPRVTKAIATSDATSAQTFGFVRDSISNNSNGFVVVIGKLSGLDTQSIPEGTQLYLSSTVAGTYTTVKQLAPNHLVYVGVVVRSHPTQGVIEVNIQNGYELYELHDVSINSPQDNQVLAYDSGTGLWVNQAQTPETFVFVQGSPSSVWSINHTLNKYPSISIVDSANNEVDGDVNYVDQNNVTLTFASAFSGKAFLN
jgi:ribosomal protein L35AE/L33A